MNGHWWMQYTWVDGNRKDEPIIRTDEGMIRLIAQASFLRQAGEDITLGAECDANYKVTAYIVHRNLKDRFVVNRFERVEEEE